MNCTPGDNVTSAIAEAIARLYAANGDNLYLIARDENRLGQISKDLEIRGAKVFGTQTLDVLGA